MAGALKITSEPTNLRISKGSGWIAGARTPYVLDSPYPVIYLIIEGPDGVGYTLANFPGYSSPYIPTPDGRLTHIHFVFGTNASATITDEGPIVFTLSSDKSSARTGESITFSGKWLPYKDINIYYWTKYFGADWREHVVKTLSDDIGDFVAIAILPSGTTDANGNTITGPTTIEFQACPPGSWPYECGGTSVSNRLPITISPGVPILPTPNTYTKNYLNSYSGPALVEPITIKTLKFFDVGESRPISLEEALFNIVMGIETASLQQGMTLLKVEANYSEDFLNYIFDIEYTYIKPQALSQLKLISAPGAVGSLGGCSRCNSLYPTIQSMIAPLLYYAIIGVIAIIGLYLVYTIVGVVKEIVFNPAGALLAGGIGLILIAGAAIFLLPKAISAIKAVKS